MAMARSSRDHRPKTNWSTRLVPTPRSEESDQNRRSGKRDSKELPIRRFWASDHQNRSWAFEGVQTTETESSRKTPKTLQSSGGISSSGEPLERAERERTAGPTGSSNKQCFAACKTEILLSAIEASECIPEMGKPSSPALNDQT